MDLGQPYNGKTIVEEVDESERTQIENVEELSDNANVSLVEEVNQSTTRSQETSVTGVRINDRSTRERSGGIGVNITAMISIVVGGLMLIIMMGFVMPTVASAVAESAPSTSAWNQTSMDVTSQMQQMTDMMMALTKIILIVSVMGIVFTILRPLMGLT